MKKNTLGIIIAGIIFLIIVLSILFITNPNKNLTSQSLKTPNDSPAGIQATPPVIKTVTVTQNGFTPKTITINAGEVIIWENKSGKAATVNSDSHPDHTKYRDLNLGEFDNGSKIQVQIQTPGSYTYHNHLSPTQKGEIIVK